ncbi:Hypothetical predicted protein [Cloeon dipterum]|uniref:DUF4794 domain-containing protein n=1 Tax=Cloeon dipterum TaxID=197152 RepID=A0A8S1CLM9_9INSE|nr:Hypothetical predicted protein [Cloeon dipterum]
MRRWLCVLTLAFLPFGLAQIENVERSPRWVPSSDPYQERVVSMLPGSDFLYPAPPASPFDFAPPLMPAQFYQPPPQPPPQQPAPIIIPVPSNSEKQEQSSKDLDVGLYTGMDIPWTHIPPFSTTYKAGLGAKTPPPLVSTAMAYPSYSGMSYPAAPQPQAYYPQPPAYYPPVLFGGPFGHWHPRSVPYPYNMRQQGGFGVRREDDDVKLTMHVPKDGAPGGILVMEMKANVYRPVY